MSGEYQCQVILPSGSTETLTVRWDTKEVLTAFIQSTLNFHNDMVLGEGDEAMSVPMIQRVRLASALIGFL